MDRNLLTREPLWTNEFDFDEFVYVCQKCGTQYSEIGDFHHSRIYNDLCPYCEEKKNSNRFEKIISK